MRHLKYLVVFICSIQFLSCFQSAEPETFLIPSNFRGEVIIVYDQECGDKPVYENDRRINNINDSGILITQFSNPTGIFNHKYYLVDENGNRSPIQTLDVRDFNEEYSLSINPNEPPRDQLAIFGMGTKGMAGGREGVKDYRFQKFFVSTYEDLNKYSLPKYFFEKDSIIRAHISECQ